MAASENDLTLNIVQRDTNDVNILNRTIGPVDYEGVAGEFHNGILIDTNSHSLDLPTTNILQFYFKNTHATAVITITGTPQGGASAVLKKVQPGGVFCAWDPVTSATAGYTALSLQSDVANATYEMFLGG